MNIRKLTPLVAAATIALASITACKKDANSQKSPMQVENEKNDAYREDMFNRICAYPYWKATAIIADSPVDIYKKGSTTDILSQRPEHQTDYYISAKKVTKTFDYPGVGKRSSNEVESKLHFGPKTLQMKRDEIAKRGYKGDEIDEKIKQWNETPFSLTRGLDHQRKIKWVKPFEEPKYTHSSAMYDITSFQNNELKLFYFDIELNTTVRVTFTGSKTIPQ